MFDIKHLLNTALESHFISVRLHFGYKMFPVWYVGVLKLKKKKNTTRTSAATDV